MVVQLVSQRRNTIARQVTGNTTYFATLNCVRRQGKQVVSYRPECYCLSRHALAVRKVVRRGILICIFRTTCRQIRVRVFLYAAR